MIIDYERRYPNMNAFFQVNGTTCPLCNASWVQNSTQFRMSCPTCSLDVALFTGRHGLWTIDYINYLGYKFHHYLSTPTNSMRISYKAHSSTGLFTDFQVDNGLLSLTEIRRRHQNDELHNLAEQASI